MRRAIIRHSVLSLSGLTRYSVSKIANREDVLEVKNAVVELVETTIHSVLSHFDKLNDL